MKKGQRPPSVAKYFLKLGLALVGGAVAGEILSPITGPVSGPALGIAAVGLPVWGLKRSYVIHALLPAAAVQAVKTASQTKPLLVAKASLSGATKALKSADAVSSSDATRARVLAESEKRPG